MITVMMRYIFLLLSINLTTTFSLSAQVVTVSEELTLRSDMAYELIGELENQYLVFLNNEHTFQVQAYDEDLRATWEKDIELEKRRPEILSIIPTTEQFTLIYQHRHKGDLLIRANVYDAGANLKDSIVIKNLGMPFGSSYYQVVRSQDRSKILLFTEHTSGEIEVFAFDLENMQLLWETSFLPENMVLSRDSHQIVVTNEGRMYYIILKNNYRSRIKDHYYEIFYQDENMESIGRYEINLGDRLTYDVYFEYDDLNDRLVAGGFHAEKNLAWAKGYFLFQLEEGESNDYQIDYYDFSEVLVNDFLERDAPSKLKGIFDTNIQQIILRQDGGLLIVAERVRTNERNYGTLPSRTLYNPALDNIGGSVDHYYEHLLVISIHPNGDKHWANVLRKRQYSQDDGAVFSSFFAIKSPRNLHFLFNDEIREENTVSEYLVKGGGSSERNSVMNTENQKLRLRFQAAVQTAADELVIPSERRNRLKLVRVKF